MHLPWGLYRVYLGGKYVGGQISYPSKSDCECLQHDSAVYAFGSPTGTYHKQKPRGVTAPAYVQWRKEKRAA